MIGWGHRDCAAVALAAALSLACPTPSKAADGVDLGKERLRTVLFGSLETGRTSFATFGAKHALTGGLDQSGPALMAVAGYGGRLERDPAFPDSRTGFRHGVQGGLLPGYQWMIGWGALATFVGPEFDYETIAPGPARSHAPGGRIGVRFQGEAWLHPTTETLLTATVVAGSARPSLWARSAAGYKVWRNVFVGPEASFYNADLYREWRLGLHATGFTLGAYEVRVSGGWRQDSETKRGGAYLGIAGHIRLEGP